MHVDCSNEVPNKNAGYSQNIFRCFLFRSATREKVHRLSKSNVDQAYGSIKYECNFYFNEH